MSRNPSPFKVSAVAIKGLIGAAQKKGLKGQVYRGGPGRNDNNLGCCAGPAAPTGCGRQRRACSQKLDAPSTSLPLGPVTQVCVTAHASLREVRRYTKAANQERLAGVGGAKAYEGQRRLIAAAHKQTRPAVGSARTRQGLGCGRDRTRPPNVPLRRARRVCLVVNEIIAETIPSSHRWVRFGPG